MRKMRDSLSKLRASKFTKEIINYLIFGLLTSLVYYLAMYSSYLILDGKNALAGSISEAIGQLLAIIFAFFTNKHFVFQHHSENSLIDFINFSLGRLLFLALAVGMKFYFIDQRPEILQNFFEIREDHIVLLFSLAIQFLNIILNYLYSKFLVFRKRR